MPIRYFSGSLNIAYTYTIHTPIGYLKIFELSLLMQPHNKI
ncbi:hypothetical protein [Eikenella glucosivorans]|nr:hypothetical protein [Eikenella glucosivorans]